MPPGRAEDGDVPRQQKAVIKAVDMGDDLQEDALKTIYEGLDKFTLEKDVASYIKKEFDRVHGPTWHAVVGRNFGSYVTHETKHFIYCYVKDIAILLFKVRLSHGSHTVPISHPAVWVEMSKGGQPVWHSVALEPLHPALRVSDVYMPTCDAGVQVAETWYTRGKGQGAVAPF